MTRAGFEYIPISMSARPGETSKRPFVKKPRYPSRASPQFAMAHLRHSDIRKVSLWLGHASIQSTEIYLRADPTEKLDALAMGIRRRCKRGKFKAPDKLLGNVQGVGKGG